MNIKKRTPAAIWSTLRKLFCSN